MMLVRPPMTNFKPTVRVDCAFSAWSPHSQPIKSFATYCQQGVGVSLQIYFMN